MTRDANPCPLRKTLCVKCLLCAKACKEVGQYTAVLLFYMPHTAIISWEWV